MTTFTDLLDEYLTAKTEHDEARSNYSGYDFDYHYFEECSRLQSARVALNIAFIEASSGSSTATGSLL